MFNKQQLFQLKGFIYVGFHQLFNMRGQIRLTYFNARGRAESSRLMLAYAGKDYEDHRIARKEDAKMICPLVCPPSKPMENGLI